MEIFPSLYTWIVLLLVVIPILYALLNQFHSLCLMPLQMKRKFDAHGIPGMPLRFLHGNLPDMAALTKQACSSPLPQLSHDIGPRIIPHFFLWSQKLECVGKPFYFWFGHQPRVMLADPEQAREILSNKSGHYNKPTIRPEVYDLMGKGLVSLGGEKWAHHRRIVSQAFFMEKLKAMVPRIAALAASMLEEWDQHVIGSDEAGSKEVDVQRAFRTLTADVIAHSAFSSSYAEGQRVFEIQHEQKFLVVKLASRAYIPGSRFVPTRTNRYRWKMINEVQSLLRRLISSRMKWLEEAGGEEKCGKDLLGLMIAANKRELEGNQKALSMSINEIVDECKTFFFAGHETTSTLLTWTMLLLGCDQMEWQERAREEVLAVCGRSDPPSADSLNHLKVVGMVLNETLRLYPPGYIMERQATKDMRMGDSVVVPRGATVVIPVVVFHHDPAYWGEDVHEFNPDRFAQGAANACTPSHAFMPFGIGPRMCVAQSFALLEAKLVLASILQRFRFHLSPGYTHAPVALGTLQPEFGMPIMFERLS